MPSIFKYVRKNSFFFLFLLTLSIGVIGFSIWHGDNPFPYSMDWDLFAHQTLFQQISQGNFHLFPSEISDTFLVNAYTPLFAILLGVGKLALPFLSFLEYFFIINMLHYFATIYIGCLFAWFITRNHLVVLVTAILNAFTFEATVAQTAFFFIPQNLAASLVVLCIYFWFKRKIRLVVVLLLLTFLLHFVIGLFGILLIGVLWLFYYFLEDHPDPSYFLRQSFIFLVELLLMAIFINWFFSFNPFGSQESIIFNFDLNQKFDLLMKWYGGLWLFYPLGVWFIAKNIRSHGNETLFITTLLSLGLLATIALPLPYSLKFYTITRYLVHLVMAVGVAQLIHLFKSPIIRTTLLIALFATHMLTFYYVQHAFKFAMRSSEVVTSVSLEELEAAEFLKIKYGNKSGVIMLSDPATQHVIEGLSGINTQGGAFANNTTRKLIDGLYPLHDVRTLSGKLLALYTVDDQVNDERNETVLLVVSGRFMEWQGLEAPFRYDEGYNVWGTRELTFTGKEYIEVLKQNETVNLVFENDAMGVFEVNKE